MTATGELARFIHQLEFEDLPKDVVIAAKRCILDHLGCIQGGSRTLIGKKVAQLVERLGGRRESTILGTGKLTSCALASFANSEMANALDYDDRLRPTGHPGAVAIPPAITVGETLHATGEQLITSVVLGYEILNRVGGALSGLHQAPELRLRSGHLWGIFGAVAAAGKLLDLDETQMAIAMGIAGSAAPIPSDVKCSSNPENKKFGMGMVKNNYGYMAEIGVRGALGAKLGYTGPRDILDGDTGFWRMACFDGCDFDHMLGRLGQDFRILQVGFKPYSCCWNIHSPIDATLKIMQDNNFGIEDIDQIVVGKLRRFSLPPWDDYTPKTVGSAVYSTPYSLAVALLGPKSGPEWFTKATLNNPEILSFAKKVQLVEDPEASGPEYSSVTISVGDKSYTEVIPNPRGDPEDPLGDEELKEKFMHLSRNRLDQNRILQILEMVMNLEEIEDISALTALFR